MSDLMFKMKLPMFTVSFKFQHLWQCQLLCHFCCCLKVFLNLLCQLNEQTGFTQYCEIWVFKSLRLSDLITSRFSVQSLHWPMTDLYVDRTDNILFILSWKEHQEQQQCFVYYIYSNDCIFNNVCNYWNTQKVGKIIESNLFVLSVLHFPLFIKSIRNLNNFIFLYMFLYYLYVSIILKKKVNNFILTTLNFIRYLSYNNPNQRIHTSLCLTGEFFPLCFVQNMVEHC